jgi:hypothetical protein
MVNVLTIWRNFKALSKQNGDIIAFKQKYLRYENGFYPFDQSPLMRRELHKHFEKTLGKK